MDPGALEQAVRAFVDETVLPGVAGWDERDDLPDDVIGRLVALGLTGALVPREHGGPGLGVADLVPAWRTLSQGWISLTGAVNPTVLATALLVRHGTPAQQERWLPRIAAGEVLASFSITEPQAGSDLGRLETTATTHPDGGLVLDGRKRWVAGGLSSDVVFLLAEADGADKPSCVVLPAEGRDSATWGLEEIDKLGYRGVESAAYVFRGHHAPGAEVLGGPDGVGAGARQMLDALDVGRVNVACRALGITDRALACAIDECTDREIGDGVLGDHTHARLRVGEMVARRAAVEALVAPRRGGRRRPRRRRPRAVDRRQGRRVRHRGVGRRPGRAPGRQPLVRRPRRARAPAPRRAADPDRRGRQRRAAPIARQTSPRRRVRVTQIPCVPAAARRTVEGPTQGATR